MKSLRLFAACAALLGAALSLSTAHAAPAKPLVIGFSQVGAESGWRTANTESVKQAAKDMNIDLRFSDAQQKQENQIKAIRAFIVQKVDYIMFSPVVETGFEPVLREAKRAGIPVVLSDRAVTVSDPSLYAAFIGSDFVKEGREAGEWLAKKTNGKAVIAELQGTPGSAPAIDRKKGFEEILAKNPGMKIVLSQTGEFTRAKGKEVMEAFLKSPEGAQVNVLFAHNDEMALGAIQAIEAAGKKPGTDIIIVSIDGTHDGLKALADGKMNCVVECNPLLGPQLMQIALDLSAGKTVPKRIETKEGIFEDSAAAAAALPTRKY